METILTDDMQQVLMQLGLQQESLSAAQLIFLILLIVLVAFLSDLICRKVFVPAVKRVVAATKVKWDDYLFSDRVLNNICHIVPSIVVYLLLPFAFGDLPSWLDFLKKIGLVYIISATLRLICVFISAIYDLSSQHEDIKNRLTKGIFQMLKIITLFVGTIIIISILIDRSPVTLFAGLGAAATILMLVFKDTIVGLVAGVQLTANDMLRPGDWIIMEKSGANGEVVEVTLTTIKIRNWDNTITTIPPYTLVSDSFQNWRGMKESDGRRVKRSLFIDMRSVRFCTDGELKHYTDMGWFQPEEMTPKMVNLGVFRRFLENYLRAHPAVNTNLSLIVRQLQLTPQGLPLELYFFSADKSWVPYEHLQADVMDYVLAILPEFGLRIFQSPTGDDLHALVSRPTEIEKSAE